MIDSVLMQTFGLGAPPLSICSFGGMISPGGIALVPSAFLILAPAARNLDPSLEEERAHVQREHQPLRLPHHPAAAAPGAGRRPRSSS